MGDLSGQAPRGATVPVGQRWNHLNFETFLQIFLFCSLLPERRYNPFQSSLLWKTQPLQWFTLQISSDPTCPSLPTVISSLDPSPSGVSPVHCIFSLLSPMTSSLPVLLSRLSLLRSLLYTPARVVISHSLSKYFNDYTHSIKSKLMHLTFRILHSVGTTYPANPLSPNSCPNLCSLCKWCPKCWDYYSEYREDSQIKLQYSVWNIIQS